MLMRKHSIRNIGQSQVVTYFRRKWKHLSFQCTLKPGTDMTLTFLNYCFLSCLKNTAENKWDVLVFSKFKEDGGMQVSDQPMLCAMTLSRQRIMEGSRSMGRAAGCKNLTNTVYWYLKFPNKSKINKKILTSNNSQGHQNNTSTKTCFILKMNFKEQAMSPCSFLLLSLQMCLQLQLWVWTQTLPGIPFLPRHFFPG